MGASDVFINVSPLSWNSKQVGTSKLREYILLPTLIMYK